MSSKLTAQSTKPQQVLTPDHLRLDPAQLKDVNAVLAAFKKLKPDQVKKLDGILQAQSPMLFQALVDAKNEILQGDFEKVGSQGKPVALDDLMKQTGWAADGWQMKLLRAMDGAGRFETDGQITAAELITGLRNPQDPQFLTTSAIDRLKAMVTASAGQDAGGALIDSITTAWMRDFAKAADADKNSKISSEELEKAYESHPELYDNLALQNLGILVHQICAATGEIDPYKIGGITGDQLGVVRQTYVGSFDQKKLVSTVVAQAVTASDLRHRGDLDRTDNFHADELLPAFLAASPDDYRKTGFDMGHLSPNADAVTKANVEASFSLLNMAPQYPELNRFSWRYLEAAVRDLIVATGARAIVYTGAAFVDDNGKPLPPEKIQTIGKKHKVAVPTHSVKCVLLEFPGGKVSTMSFMIPNRKDLPTDVEGCKKLIQSSRISLDDATSALGVKPFDGLLPTAFDAEIRKDKTATVPMEAVPAGAKQPDASAFLWGKNANPKVWNMGFSQLEIDPALEALKQAMAMVKGEPKPKPKKTTTKTQATPAQATPAQATVDPAKAKQITQELREAIAPLVKSS
ncbi:MAG: DNA/RNA non-specific endonuclease [Myxococcota bacterium]